MSKFELQASLYRKRIFKAGEKPVSSHSSARRYSLVQAATVGALNEMAEEAPEFFEKIFQSHAPFVYASAVGDITSHATIASQIVNNSLPVSPIAFQNSVMNAAVASFLIEKKRHNPHYALSQCGASFDTAILQAAQIIDAGECDGVVVALCTEGTKIATCEVLALGTPQFLRDTPRKFSLRCETLTEMCDDKPSVLMPRLLDLDNNQVQTRRVVVANRSGIETVWRPL